MRLPTEIRGILLALMAFSAVVSPTVAMAVPVGWTDWTSAATSTVLGTLLVDSTPVSVTYSGPYSFAQVSGGTNYWVPSAPYISSAVDNAPPDSDIVALGVGGAKTITFSQAVEDPLLALVSWNGNVVDFGVPIEIVSFGAGFWGNGTPVLNAAGTGFTGVGEVHGVIRLPGTYSSISFTDTSESWHGFTVGAVGIAETPVPEPATVVLLGSGLAALAGFRRKCRK